MALERFKRPVATADVDATVATVACTMRARGVGCVIVTRGGRAVGIITDRDLVLRVLAEGKDAKTTRAEEIATLEPILALEGESIEAVVTRMETHGVRRIPIITRDGSVSGIVTSDDLVMLLGRELGGIFKMIESSSDSTVGR
jgi:CBS domain-containing protein